MALTMAVTFFARSQLELVHAAHGHDGGDARAAGQVHQHFGIDRAGSDLGHRAVELVAGGEQIVLGIVHQQDKAGLDQGHGFHAGLEAQLFGAGLGDGSHNGLAALDAQFHFIIDRAGTDRNNFAVKNISCAGFHTLSPCCGAKSASMATVFRRRNVIIEYLII